MDGMKKINSYAFDLHMGLLLYHVLKNITALMRD